MSGTCPAAVKQTICKQISPAQAAQISWACHMQGRQKKKKERKEKIHKKKSKKKKEEEEKNKIVMFL
jgi:hypothetical protein